MRIIAKLEKVKFKDCDSSHTSTDSLSAYEEKRINT